MSVHTWRRETDGRLHCLACGIRVARAPDGRPKTQGLRCTGEFRPEHGKHRWGDPFPRRICGVWRMHRLCLECGEETVCRQDGLTLSTAVECVRGRA